MQGDDFQFYIVSAHTITKITNHPFYYVWRRENQRGVGNLSVYRSPRWGKGGGGKVALFNLNA